MQLINRFLNLILHVRHNLLYHDLFELRLNQLSDLLFRQLLPRVQLIVFKGGRSLQSLDMLLNLRYQ